MCNRNLQIGIATLLWFLLTGLHAQNAIPAAGGVCSASGGSVSFTAGQVFYTVLTGPNGSVSQGVQQPYEISVITGIEENPGIILTVSAFPNPVTESLTLSVEREGFENLGFKLLDISGKLIESREITADKTQINMGKLVGATYLLQVTSEDSVIKTFKIIKK